ncbi:hypothetical protein Tco_0570337 [Tanacetum coccineum]
MELEADKDFTQESQKKKQEQEEAQKKKKENEEELWVPLNVTPQRVVITLRSYRGLGTIKFKVKDFIQAIKESSCKRRSKLAFENADFEFESRVDTFKDKEIYPVI